MEDTYITLYSHQYYQIVNKSSVPVEFSWRAFQTEVEENKKKSQLISQLNDEESEERMILEESNLEESMAESLDSDDSYDEDELNRKQERAQTKAITTLARKYQSIRKAVEEDLMLFQDEIFTIEPLQGKLWPNTEITCCVTFKPQGPLHYSCTAFCNITCSEERLPLNLTGQGIGPKAQLIIKELDIGDIFVNSKVSYDIAIENMGDITCYYKLIDYETPFGSKFKFSRTEGKLGVQENQKEVITVSFQSDILGEFSETFRWALEGSVEMLSLTFKGHVVAPTFKFSEEIIDFGQVSYKFPVTKTVYLTNTSDVEINYVIRVPGDERSLQNEFNITNDRGKLEKNQRQKIIIEFIPCFPQQYDMVLVVDLEGVGQDMLAVPIKAECIVPKVKITPSDYLDFKDVFLRHPKTVELELKNEDFLDAKFEILPQEENYKRVGIFKADQESGIIPAKSIVMLQITLKTEMITNNVRIPMSIKIEGYHIPFMLNILANSTGPKVIIDHEELDFGSVDVLHDVIRPLKITNVSKIPAEYTAFTKNKVSVYKVIQRHGILQPDESKVLDVVCNADECQKFPDTLHIIINNGMDLEVGLKAKGIGTTLACKENLKEVNFGTKYTHSNETLEFFLENRGRKPQKISWSRVTKPADRNKTKAAPKNEPGEEAKLNQSNRDATMISEKKEENEELKYVFAVVPDQITLQPKMGIFIQFRANSFVKGKMSEQFV
jgi:hydrocephalus-inducing protein